MRCVCLTRPAPKPCPQVRVRHNILTRLTCITDFANCYMNLFLAVEALPSPLEQITLSKSVLSHMKAAGVAPTVGVFNSLIHATLKAPNSMRDIVLVGQPPSVHFRVMPRSPACEK